MKKLIIVAIAAVAMFASSAYAADWDFYGSARIWTFSTDVEENGTSDSDRNTNWELSPYSRIGANVKVSDEIRGRFEYGTSGGNANIRLLYGVWNFGSGELYIGQDYKPVHIAYSNQVYDGLGLGGFGDAYRGRSAQLKLVFGEFQIALIEPFADDAAVAGSVGDVEVTLPQIQARYTFRFDNGSARVAAGYNTFEIDDEDVNSYVIAGGADFSFGALRLAGSIAYGQNSEAIIDIDTKGDDDTDGMAAFVGGDLKDNETLGFNLIIGYTINDMLSIEAGYGWIEQELDDGDDDEAASYYVQMPIVLAPGVTVTPEVGIIDYDENGQDEATYFGAHWQINF